MWILTVIAYNLHAVTNWKKSMRMDRLNCNNNFKYYYMLSKNSSCFISSFSVPIENKCVHGDYKRMQKLGDQWNLPSPKRNSTLD
jgi:hypothetical protein